MDRISELAIKIVELLDKYDVGYQTAIYYRNKRTSYFGDDWYTEENIKASDYVDFHNDETITMTFEGTFYDVVNYGILPNVHEEFLELIDSYGYYYELGDAWNLSLYNK